MMTILNRLRGTQGLWSKINGLLLAFIVLAIWGNVWVAIAVGLGYIIGESFGWGLWVGNLTEHMNDTMPDDGEGKNNGIQWIARKLVPSYATNMVRYCQVALSIRGFYWWLPTLAPLYFVGFNPYAIAVAVLILSVGFPFACWNGYLLKDTVSIDWMDIKGGWNIQEVAYGLIQDFVIIGLIGAYYYGLN